MKKLIKATLNFTMQRASVEVCEKFSQPLGIIEVLDSDGFRQCFAETEAAAVESVRETLIDELGLSGGIALGTVDVEVQDLELSGTPVGLEDGS